MQDSLLAQAFNVHLLLTDLLDTLSIDDKFLFFF